MKQEIFLHIFMEYWYVVTGFIAGGITVYLGGAHAFAFIFLFGVVLNPVMLYHLYKAYKEIET